MNIMLTSEEMNGARRGEKNDAGLSKLKTF